MVEVEIIGGAAFPKNSLTKAYANPEANKYTVEFKDGTVLVFPEQPYEREAEAKVTLEGRIDFYGFADAEIIDTPKNDVYRLLGCSNVLVKADDAIDSDWIQVTDRRLSTGEIQKSHNNRIFLNKNDIYIGPNAENIEVELKDTDINV